MGCGVVCVWTRGTRGVESLHFAVDHVDGLEGADVDEW